MNYFTTVQWFLMIFWQKNNSFPLGSFIWAQEKRRPDIKTVHCMSSPRCHYLQANDSVASAPYKLVKTASQGTRQITMQLAQGLHENVHLFGI